MVLISGMSPEIDIIETENVPRDLVFDNSKMKKNLGVPKVELMEGLNNEWNYMKNLRK